MMHNDPTSEELMSLVASGDKRAFSHLMARHRITVYCIVYRFFKTQQEADDMFQEVFLRIWRSAKTYEPTSKFSTWLYTVTANQCKSELASLWRRNVRLIGSFWSEGTPDALAASTPSTEETVSRNQEAELVRSAVSALPPKQRLALILSRYEGLSYEEIAAVMECSVSSVESLLFRAKCGLRNHLESQ